jgi:hypothetical protein
MNYVVNKYPDEKENIFGRQKVIWFDIHLINV